MQKTPDFMPQFKANLPRTDHVLSHDLTITATTGHLNPVFHTLVNPGETVKLGYDFHLRTMPLDAAAFTNLTCHTEFFFVPMQLLYQGFDAAYYNITDLFSSNFYSQVAGLPLEDFDSDIASLYTNRANAAMLYPDTTFPIESVGQSAIRLFDLLGFNPVGIACLDSANNHFYNPNVFPYPFLAYNCIYQYYYRLDSRETFDNTSFNVDSYYTAVNPSSMLKQADFLMKYRPLDNDYFTDVKVSPIVDVLNLNSKGNFELANNWLSRNNISSIQVLKQGDVGSPAGAASSLSPTANPKTPASNITTNFGFTAAGTDPDSVLNGLDINTANIRAMFANEKLWSITGRAKKNYDDQTLAHFGFKVPHDVKHQITCFGHDISRISIGEVISTANTSLSPLGEIAGKGYASQSGTVHSFTAPCHGVVMAIFSVVCEHNYEAGILKANMVASKNDLYIPEYDHLGMQPMFGYETMFYEKNDNLQFAILGWQYRYEQWKRRYNRTNGAFRNSVGTLKTWRPTFAPYGGNSTYVGDAGKFDNQPNTPSYKSFLNFPTDVNQIFLAQYPEQWSTAFEGVDDWAHIYDNDPFVVDSHVNCVLISTMSNYALPRLDA